MKVNLIGFSGKKGSGKDALVEIMQRDYVGWQNKKFADPIKDITCMILGCDRGDLEKPGFKESPLSMGVPVTPRIIMQKLGTEFGREMIYKDIWVDALFNEYFKLCNDQEDWRNNSDCPKWVISDVRFPNEVEAIKKAGGLVIRIERDGLGGDDHPSEVYLDGYKDFDATLYNNGTIDDLGIKLQFIFGYLDVEV